MNDQVLVFCQQRHVHLIKGFRNLAEKSHGVFQSHPKFLFGLIFQLCPVNRDQLKNLIYLFLCVSALELTQWGNCEIHKSCGFKSCVYPQNRNRPGLWQRGAPVIMSRSDRGPPFGSGSHRLSSQLCRCSTNVDSCQQTQVLGFLVLEPTSCTRTTHFS